jgi:hypothetical protein
MIDVNNFMVKFCAAGAAAVRRHVQVTGESPSTLFWGAAISTRVRRGAID